MSPYESTKRARLDLARLLKISAYLERKILRCVRRIPKATYSLVQSECDTPLSKTTLYRLLKKTQHYQLDL